MYELSNSGWNSWVYQPLKLLQVLSTGIAADGSFIVSGSADETINLWSIGGGDRMATFYTHKGVQSVTMATKISRVFALCGENSLNFVALKMVIPWNKYKTLISQNDYQGKHCISVFCCVNIYSFTYKIYDHKMLNSSNQKEHMQILFSTRQYIQFLNNQNQCSGVLGLK